MKTSQKKETMTVREMREILGIKKTDSYWLIKRQYFKTVIVDGKPEEIEGYDLTPRGIIKFLDLKRPIYEETAKYGHFGEGFDWDK